MKDDMNALCARRTRTMKKIGRVPMLVLCSRNARPEKGLVRRPHVDQHGCPSWRESVGELRESVLGQSKIVSVLAQRAVEDSPRWTRAVEDQSAPVPEEIMSKLGGSIDMHSEEQSGHLSSSNGKGRWKRTRSTRGWPQTKT